MYLLPETQICIKVRSLLRKILSRGCHELRNSFEKHFQTIAQTDRRSTPRHFQASVWRNLRVSPKPSYPIIICLAREKLTLKTYFHQPSSGAAKLQLLRPSIYTDICTFTPKKKLVETLLQFVRRLSSPLCPTPDTRKTIQKKSIRLCGSPLQITRRSAGIHQHRPSRATSPSVNARGCCACFRPPARG